MGATTSPTPTRGPRARGSARGPARAGAVTTRDEEFDLLTAALLGIALGVGTAMLMRRKPSGYRAAAGIAMAAARGDARRMGKRSRQALEDVGDIDVDRQLRKYLSRARSSIDDMVESELHQLRRAIRRQRKRLGV